MQLHTLRRAHKNKKIKIVGRGGKHAKTSGRGTKGQNARAGHKKRPEMRDFIKRIPKLRGRGKNINTSIQEKAKAFNLGRIDRMFKDGDAVTLATLGVKRAKILGTGELTKKLSFSGVEISASARARIEKAGGTIA